MKLSQKKSIITAIIFILILSVIQGCQDKEELPEATATTFAMDTIIQMKAYGVKAQEVIDASFGRIRDIENRMSAHIKSSQIEIINSNPGQEIKVDKDTFLVIKKALEYAKLTEGKFDPSIGPLVQLWGIGTEKARVPDDKEIKDALSVVNYRWIELNEENTTVKITKKGMRLDLGAIVKGYAADEVRRIVLENKIKSAYVNLGGNVMVIGSKPDGSLWNIGIQDPRLERGSVMASIRLEDKTIVTSGNYERYFIEDGILYHHIIDPITGKPARSGVISASIITQNSFDADALSTSVFILGPEKGMELVEKLPHIEAIIITDDLKVIISSGLIGKVKILDPDFKLRSE